MIDVLAVAAAERRALADDLERLTDAQWRMPSALRGWEIRHVASHVVWPLESSLFTMAGMFVRAGFRLSRTVDLAAAADVRTHGEMAAALRAQAGNTRILPGVGPAGLLLDLFVHALDIRQPLGLPHAFPADAAVMVLKRLGRPHSLAFFGVPTGFRLVARDLNWSSGQGPVVEGASPDLMLALAGRAPTLPALSGDGVVQFRARFKEYGG